MFFGYFSVVMLVAAVVMAAVIKSNQSQWCPDGTFVDRLYRWTLLLSVGVQGVYTFVGHVFFPEYAARKSVGPSARSSLKLIQLIAGCCCSFS